MQQMERHDDLAVGAELHSTVESPMELVERQRSAFYNPLTVAKEDDDILSSLLHEDGGTRDSRHWMLTDIRNDNLRLGIAIHDHLFNLLGRHPFRHPIRLRLAQRDLPACQVTPHGRAEILAVPSRQEGDVGYH